jgi:hypothetical protein
MMGDNQGGLRTPFPFITKVNFCLLFPSLVGRPRVCILVLDLMCQAGPRR